MWVVYREDRIAPTDPLLRLAPLPPHTSTPNNSDRVTRENLEFFLAVAVGQDADPWTDYIIAVNGPSSVPLDALPANVRVVRRERSVRSSWARWRTGPERNNPSAERVMSSRLKAWPEAGMSTTTRS